MTTTPNEEIIPEEAIGSNESMMTIGGGNADLDRVNDASETQMVEETMNGLNARQVCARLRYNNGDLVDPPIMQQSDFQHHRRHGDHQNLLLDRHTHNDNASESESRTPNLLPQS